MTDLWTNPRNHETKAYTGASDAIDEDFTIAASATINSLCVELASALTTEDEEFEVQLKDSDDNVIINHVFVVSDSSNLRQSKAFVGWQLSGAGVVNVAFANADANVRAITLSWIYDQK